MLDLRDTMKNLFQGLKRSFRERNARKAQRELRNGLFGTRPASEVTSGVFESRMSGEPSGLGTKLAGLRARDSLVALLFLQAIVCATVFFDIPVARAVVGFLYLTFLPGYIIIKMLRLDELDGSETILFSAGLSIAFLMLAGLSMNEFSVLFGVSRPLSIMPLMTVLNSLIFMGGVFVYLRGKRVKLWRAKLIEAPFALLFLCLPILSVVGAIWVNAYGSNSLLLSMIAVIPVLFAIGVLSKKLLPSKSYPFALLMTAIAILYHSSLISSYIVPFGSDIPIEYFLFKTTENNAHWSSIPPFFWGRGYGRTNAMLSVTILPAIYSTLLNINPTWMFKLLFPLIFSLVPVGLYQIWQTYVGEKYALLSALLFMAQSTFYTEMLGLNRQMIAELFFVLLLLLIVNEKIEPLGKMICFMIFSFALVTSHYALAEIFLFFISFTLVSLLVLKRPSRNITVTMAVFFFAVMFTWYIYTSGSATFDSLLQFGDYVYNQLGDFFNPASRGQTVLRGLGMEESPSIWNTLSRTFAYLTQAFIVAGFVCLMTRKTRISLEKEFFILSLIAMVFLAAVVLVPGLAETLNMTRFYHILLFFLAPLCAVGAELIVELLSKRENELAVFMLLLIVLVPYFLFQTGFVYEVTGSDVWSIPLSKHRMSALRLYGLYGYADEFSVYGAQWLSKNVDVKNSGLYADERARANVLTIYGMIYGGYVNVLTNTTIVADNGTIYLSTLNVVKGVIPFGRLSWKTSELSFIFDDSNVVYANGGSKICKHSP